MEMFKWIRKQRTYQKQKKILEIINIFLQYHNGEPA